MAKKKDLAKAAQDATRMMFGTPAGVQETSGDATGTQDAISDGERPQDAPEAPEKRRRGRPKKKTAETSMIADNTALGALLKERRKAIEEGRVITVSTQDPEPDKEPDRTKATVYVQDQEPEQKTVTRKVVFTEKTPTTPTNKTIEVTKASKTPAKKNRTKNSGDYLRLDMVSEGTDLKKYVGKMARIKGVSMTAYIQDLILKDMKKNEGKSFTITV